MIVDWLRTEKVYFDVGTLLNSFVNSTHDLQIIKASTVSGFSRERLSLIMRVTVEKADSDETPVAGIANNKIVTKIYLLKQLLYYLIDGISYLEIVKP
jgi:hypothetical protein